MNRQAHTPGDSLCEAARNGDLEQVRQFLAAGADPNTTDETDSPPLFWAVGGGFSDIVQELLQAGADPNWASDAGQTPLMLAAGMRRPEIVEALLKAGAEVHAADAQGWTALAHSDDQESEALLRQFGAQRLVIEPSEDDVAGRRSEEQRRRNEKARAAEEEIRAVRTDDRIALTLALQEAIKWDLPAEALRLIHLGADVNYREDNELPTVLTWAAYRGHVDVLRAAIENGADLEATAMKQGDGWIAGTALIQAAATGNVQIVKLLIEAGANVDAEGCGEHCQGPALRFADYYNHHAVLEYLRRKDS